MIRGRGWAIAVLALSLGCLAMWAPGAGATPKHRHRHKPAPERLLGYRSCQGLLSISDFPGTVREEVSPEEPRGVTLCKFVPQSSLDEPDVGGYDELIVSSRSVYLHKGKPQNLLEGPLQKAEEAAGEKFTHLHGIGTRAEIVESTGSYAGLVQVRNDVFKIENADAQPVGFQGLLSRVAHELAPGGK
jgi:hypothetical protein